MVVQPFGGAPICKVDDGLREGNPSFKDKVRRKDQTQIAMCKHKKRSQIAPLRF